MQSAEVVLGVLRERGRKGLPCNELYRQLFNPQLYLLAYGRIYSNQGAMTQGPTQETADDMSIGKIETVIDAMRHERYRFSPVRRTFIPKKNGKLRPLGLPSWSDKLVGEVVRLLLEAYYEPRFSEYSHGFRPGRGCHTALREIANTWSGTTWFIEGDISDCFTSLDHDWLARFVEHRVADKRVLRLIRKWLNAGVIEDGEWAASEVGAPQGASASPLLANIYLHYVLDRWARQWRRRHAHGEVIIVRFADDFVAGFEHKSDAEQFLDDLRERFSKFGLELHPDKTRLIEFGRNAARDRAARGERKPETFDFLGFTHMCGKNKSGGFWLRRKTISKRMRAKLVEVKDQIKRRRHLPIPEQGKWLGSVVRGHLDYYAVPGNTDAVAAFRDEVTRYWFQALRRRSQRTRVSWDRMSLYVKRWLPPARPMHPLPIVRFNVRTQGRSPVR